MKQETLKEAAYEYAELYRCPATNENEYCKHDIISAFNNGAKWQMDKQDDFAIGFAEWISYKYKYLETKGWFSSSYELEMGIFKSSKELLEIYKKENGL